MKLNNKLLISYDDDEDKRVKIELTDTASNVHDKEGNLDCSAGGASRNKLVVQLFCNLVVH